MNRQHYLYRHIRLDTNEVFYIGIGTKSERKYHTHVNEYSRAYIKNTKGRTLFWHRVANKTNYEVEIIFEHEDYEFIKEKEKEFIKLYGRRDLGLGTLVNLTDGGDGVLGSVKSEENRKNISARQTGELNHMFGKKGKLSPLYGIPKTEEHKKSLSVAILGVKHIYAKKVQNIITLEIWDCIKDAALANNMTSALLGYHLNNPKNKTNFVFYFEK